MELSKCIVSEPDLLRGLAGNDGAAFDDLAILAILPA